MFCPRCRCEYIDGIKICPDCNADLVDELPRETEIPSEQTYNLTVVFTSTNPGTIALAKSILESEDIEYYVNNEFMQTVYGIGSGFPAQIVVRESDKKNAIFLLSTLE